MPSIKRFKGLRPAKHVESIPYDVHDSEATDSGNIMSSKATRFAH